MSRLSIAERGRCHHGHLTPNVSNEEFPKSSLSNTIPLSCICCNVYMDMSRPSKFRSYFIEPRLSSDTPTALPQALDQRPHNAENLSSQAGGQSWIFLILHLPFTNIWINLKSPLTRNRNSLPRLLNLLTAQLRISIISS